MFEIISGILGNEEGSLKFSPFGLWHIFYLILIFIPILITIYILWNKSEETKKKTINITINCAFGLYILDFFLMPFSYGYIDIDKLPFHLCTLTAIMCFICRNNKFFSKYKTQFTLLGLIGALMYITYPSGIADGEVYPFCYRIVQTMLFHGLMVAHGIFSLAFSDIVLKWKKIYKELIVIVIITLIAVVANNLYSGEREFNWFFVSSDPFGIFNDEVGKFIMPPIMVGVIFLMNSLIYLLYFSF